MPDQAESRRKLFRTGGYAFLALAALMIAVAVFQYVAAPECADELECALQPMRALPPLSVALVFAVVGQYALRMARRGN